MYTVSISEVRGIAPTYNFAVSNEPTVKETVVGLKATIEPPVDLNPVAVRNYVDAGNLAGLAEGVGDFHNPILVGSTAEATTIYTDVHPQDNQTRRRELLGARVSGLLGYMGLETEVRQPQA